MSIVPMISSSSNNLVLGKGVNTNWGVELEHAMFIQIKFNLGARLLNA